MDVSTTRIPWLGFPPGVLLGCLLSIAQVVIQSLLAPDFQASFLISSMLLYLLVPFCASFFSASQGWQPRDARAIGWQAALTSALLAIFASLVMYYVVSFLMGMSRFLDIEPASTRVVMTYVLSFLGLVLLNLGGFAGALVVVWSGAWIGNAMARRVQPGTLPGYTPRQRRRMGCGRYPLFMPLVAALAGVQLLTQIGLAQGLLPALEAVYASPTDAFTPFPLEDFSLTASQDRLYEQASPYSYILRAHDGLVSQKIAGTLFATYQGIVYTTSDRTIQARKASDGRVLWTIARREIDHLQLLNGIIYYSDFQRGLVALNPLTGRQLWQFACPISAPGCAVALPQVSNGIVYTSIWEDGPVQFVALRARDGALIWTVPQTRLISPGPYLLHDRIVLHTAHASLSAFNPADGHLLWHISLPYDAQDSPLVSSPENADLFLLLQHSGVAARSIKTGALLWQRPLTIAPQAVFLTSRAVYLTRASQGGTAKACPCLAVLHAATGLSAWQRDFGPSLAPYTAQADMASFQVVGESHDLVYLQSGHFPRQFDGFSVAYASVGDMLLALHLLDGSLAWQHRISPFPAEPLPNSVTPTSSDLTLVTNAPALLVGPTLYFAYRELVSNEARILHIVFSALNAFLPRTSISYATFAFDAQTGTIIWQQRQTETYQVI